MKKIIIDIDAEFEDVHFDEGEIKKFTALKEYYSDPRIRAKSAEKSKNAHAKRSVEERQALAQKIMTTPGWQQNNEHLRQRQSRSIVTPYGEFDSIATTAKMLDVDVSTVKNYMKREPDNWYLVNPKIDARNNKQSTDVVAHRAKKCQKQMQTPRGIFASRKAVAEEFGVSTVTVTNWLSAKPHEFFYLDK